MNIAILGFGTVGQGLYQIIEAEKENDQKRTQQNLHVKYILVKNKNKKRKVDFPKEILTDDFAQIVNDPEIDAVVEVTSEKAQAVTYMKACLAADKHVVTANKAALALAFFELQDLAKAKQKHLKFEASVAGGIPVLGSLTRLLAFNQISELYGIINSSTNYVLSEISAGKQLEEVIVAAKELGVLEADPTDDLAGYDARRKLAILSMMILGQTVQEAEIPLLGISNIKNKDIAILAEHGYQVKLIAELLCREEMLGKNIFYASVLPTAIRNSDFKTVSGLMNEVAFVGTYCEELRFTGKGGTRFPTADAVMLDLYELGISRPLYFRERVKNYQNQALKQKSQFYLRLSQEQIRQNHLTEEIALITANILEQGQDLIILSKELSIAEALALAGKGAVMIRLNEQVL